MASQDGILIVTGSIDDYVGYKRKGKPCLRRKAKSVRRSEATKLSAIDFGTASKAGKLIRRGVKQALDIRTDDQLTNRLNKTLLQALYASSDKLGTRTFKREEMAALTGFQFNKTTDLGRLLNFRPKVVQDGKGNLRIALPALTAKDIRHARNTTHIEIKAIAVGVNFNEGEYQDAVSDKVLIDFSKPAEAKELVLPFKACDEETIVVLQVSAYSEWNGKLYRLDNLKYFAADIIDVIPSVVTEEANLVHHSQATKKPLFQLHGDNTFATPQRE
ncbi:hypothetical protein GFS24_03675 [Chitinophaga sp. SYP-B3965]|uniref:hypothetical protein n=1 Tax=Chitinophaga sp. SYP-B3965 TaxID=2663120 RepID=UPI001299F371|nr:hypothetical protein [Chitinophaga sp. SYP-B3965]MRG44196.1 hypothetical protein [Chitinophaga sp. SYP-B3965]